MPSGHLQLDATVYPSGTRHAPHSHDELQLSLVLRGQISERVGNATELASALSVVTKDPAVVHANDFGKTGAVMVRLSIGNCGLADLTEHPSRAPNWRWTHDLSVAAPFLRIVARGQRDEVRFDTDDNDVTDLLAALTARRTTSSQGVPPEWLRTAMTHMHDGWRPSLSVREVARAADVHPVYLARCVRRWYGLAAAEVLRRARMIHAANALSRSETTVSTTAHRAGFADEPHLCRDFARATGVTPGRFRRIVREAEMTPSRRPSAG